MTPPPARIVTAEKRPEDDPALRPQTLADFAGQEAARANLKVFIESAKTRSEALTLFERIHRLLTDDAAPVDDDELGKLAALSGVREFPARVKCASLCWHTLAKALQSNQPQAVAAVSTE